MYNYENIYKLYEKYKGPVWVYNASTIIHQIKQLKKFDIIRFAQKSCSNIHILRLMRKYGIKVDAISLGEIERAVLAGFQTGDKYDEIVFVSDVLEEEALYRILQLNIPVNIGSIDMLEQLGICSPGHRIWLRINPGFGYGHNQKTNTGGENSKHGIWYSDIPIALSYIHRYNLQLVGLHMHIGSGVYYHHLAKVCDSMIEQVLRYKINFKIISAGGGLTVPYRHSDKVVNVDNYFTVWDHVRRYVGHHLGCEITLEIEPGRFLVAESGILITQVRVIKDMGSRHFVLIDAGYNDLMRPILYGSYHHISLIPKDHRCVDFNDLRKTIVAGPLCESGDIFTQSIHGKVLLRELPNSIKIGDYLIFHDTGAYGSSMSSNYNTRPLLPEVLFDENGFIQEIRRKQNLNDLFKLEVPEYFLYIICINNLLMSLLFI